jgi:hypothetical protein
MTADQDSRVTQARETLAATASSPGDYGTAYGQRSELRLALEQLLAAVDEKGGFADDAVRAELRATAARNRWLR